MGWWSKDILGGDTPLDIEDGIYDLFGIQKFPDNPDAENGFDHVELSKEDFQNNWDKLEGFVQKEMADAYDDPNIVLQVLGFQLHKVGLHFGEFGERILEAVRNDEWAKQDSERREILQDWEDGFEGMVIEGKRIESFVY